MMAFELIFGTVLLGVLAHRARGWWKRRQTDRAIHDLFIEAAATARRRLADHRDARPLQGDDLLDELRTRYGRR